MIRIPQKLAVSFSPIDRRPGRVSRLRPLLALCAAALFACRAVSVASDPRPTYSIDVHNETTVALIISYNDGRGDAVLGTVPANATERFIIASPQTTTVTVRGTNESRTRTVGPYTIELVAGTPQPVRLR
jgi:hypothetical protein